MARLPVRLAPGADGRLAERFAAIRAELGVPAEFPPDVLAAAQEAAAAGPVDDGHVDLTDIPFVTIDPPGATDLDQAMALSRRGGGFHVDYAIADVPAFVDPAGPVAAEAMRRGQTVYAPDGRTPLHPPVLSEGAASLLPGEDRPAFVWRFDLDADGEVERAELVRARVRSRRQLDYATVQAAATAPHGAEAGIAALAVQLREIGEMRRDLERRRGGANLPLPRQEVVPAPDGGYGLHWSPPLPAEDWNAQISLMTGIVAGGWMLGAGIGVLRMMPPPKDEAMARFRAQAGRLGVEWPDGTTYGEFLRGLDATRPEHLAVLHAAAALFRGATYLSLDGAAGDPEDVAVRHAAVAAPYAHVTAPLRRLVDRFGLVACHSIATGREVPDWVRAALPELPAAMERSDRLAGEVERRCVDAVEAALLAGGTGRTYRAVVVAADDDGDGGRVQLADPLVLARCSGPLVPGETAEVVLEAVDEAAGAVKFAVRPVAGARVD